MKGEKFDLKEMLQEALRESPQTDDARDRDLDQKDINKLINERKKSAPRKEQNPPD